MPDNDLCETPQATQQSVLNRSGKDKFLLVLNLPKVLYKQSILDEKIDIDPLQISIHGAVVPPIQVPSVEVRFGGQSYNVSSYARPNYPPLTVNFIIDNKFRNYWLLWKWLGILNDPNNSLYAGTPTKSINQNTPYETNRDKIDAGMLTEYQANFSVVGLNEYNQKAIEFVYHNGFITNLGGINYSYRDSEILESTVEFQYSKIDVEIPS
jgi:hypothetical protein